MRLFDYDVEEQLLDGLIDEARAEFLDVNSYYINTYKNIKPANAELQKFLTSVLPQSKNDYCLYVADNEGNKKTYMLPYEQYINSICALADNVKHTLFYSVCDYNGWCITPNAKSSQCIYIDIDNVGFDIYSLSQNEVIEYLIKTYNIPADKLPNMIVLSGRGCHLYYLTQRTSDFEAREVIAKNMIGYFYSDFSAKNITHKIRVPFSYNMKNDCERKTKLYNIHEHRFSFDELSFFEIDKYELDERQRAWNDLITAKRLATRKLNGTTTSKSDCNSATSENVKEPDGLSIVSLDGLHYISKNYYNSTNKNRNLLNDLNNYVIRHDGDLSGKRDIFCFIYSNYAKHLLTQEQCCTELQKYVDETFYDELDDIISYVYSRDEAYHYRYSTIAEFLEFTQQDIEDSYCCFCAERKAQALKQKHKRYNDKRYGAKRTQKQLDRDYVANNLDKTTSELCFELEDRYSVRTIRRWVAEFTNGVVKKSSNI